MLNAVTDPICSSYKSPAHVTGIKRTRIFLQAVLSLPADLGITAADAHAKASISELTEGRSELVCLALWIMAERSEVR